MMFPPETIYDKIIADYQGKTTKIPKKLIHRDNLSFHSDYEVHTLRKLCLDCIVVNWEELKLINECIIDEDARYILDNLSIDLTFNLAIKYIFDDLYWRRAFQARWPGKMLPTKPVKMDYDIPNQYNRNLDGYNRKRNKNVIKINTWKCFYVERYLQDFLEHLKPEDYNAEQMKELMDLSRDYIIRLKLNQLQAHAEYDKHRIPLQTILPALRNLQQLHICFKQTYASDDFSWHILQTSTKDVQNLNRGLEKCDLDILRVVNTDITCNKVTMIAYHLTANKNLRILDFSHCKIADQGTIAICRLLIDLPHLEEVNLMNNFIDSRGFQFLSFVLTKPGISLKRLHLSLNKLTTLSGANYLARMLMENTKLTELNLAACGLNPSNIEMLIKALEINKTLRKLDLSNNLMSQSNGNLFLKLLNAKNRSLQTLDLRMTRLSPQIVSAIDDVLNDPQRKSFRNMFRRSSKSILTTSQQSFDVRNTIEDVIIAARKIQEKETQEKEEIPKFENIDELDSMINNVYTSYLNASKDVDNEEQEDDDLKDTVVQSTEEEEIKEEEIECGENVKKENMEGNCKKHKTIK